MADDKKNSLDVDLALIKHDLGTLKINLEETYNLVDVVSNEIVEVNKVLASQAAVLAEHQRRSLANEKSVAMLEEDLQARHEAMIKAITPSVRMTTFINNSVKLIVAIAGVIGFLAAIYAAVKQ